MDLDEFRERAAAEQGLVAVATARADGSIQSTVVNAGVMPHPVSGAPVVAFVAGGPVKLANLRARPWATVTVRTGWRWTTVEGSAELAGPDDALSGVESGEHADRVPGLLRAIFTAAGGTHDDWAEFDATMARERRAAVLVTPGRVYGV
jgi:PPOX class probable F420-dependent enzyme